MKRIRETLPAVILFGIAALAILAAVTVLFYSGRPSAPEPEPSAPVSESPALSGTTAPVLSSAPVEQEPEPSAMPETSQTPETPAAPAISAEYLLSLEPSPLYATIWPVKELDVYADPAGETVIGTVFPGEMYCVLAEEKDLSLFRIRFQQDVFGYIDSTYCLINLPEYIGDLCTYDITNSYSSLFAVHEYEIPGLTGNVITGYENVSLADGSFLVPFLYPCTEKLISAAKQALEAGYRIRIYDAYRPRTATRAIYNTAMTVMPCALPAQTYSGLYVSLPPVPEAKEGEPQRNYLIYRDLIELWGWDLGSFLAPGASRHNMGVALDLTFEDLQTGEAVTAQTSMHDLSAYSTIRSNNDASVLIYRILEANGLKNIVSEWWHFQDNAAMNSLKPPYCECSVSAEGWIADENGERYRNADGSIVRDCVMVTEEGSFSFDGSGYRIG